MSRDRCAGDQYLAYSILEDEPREVARAEDAITVHAPARFAIVIVDEADGDIKLVSMAADLTNEYLSRLAGTVNQDWNGRRITASMAHNQLSEQPKSYSTSTHTGEQQQSEQDQYSARRPLESVNGEDGQPTQHHSRQHRFGKDQEVIDPHIAP